MTNRKTYTVFRSLGDLEILTKIEEVNADKNKGKGVIVILGSEHFEIKLRENSIGTWLFLTEFDKEEVIYGRYLSRDCEDIEAFLKLAKGHLRL